MSIRGQFGLTDTRNVSHGSDSDETARREIQFFFPDFDQQDFFLPGGEADALQQPGKAQLDRVNFLHYFVSRKQ